MRRARRQVLPGLIVVAVLVGGGWLLFGRRDAPPVPRPVPAPKSGAQVAREKLFAELRPVQLANCTLQRFGEPHDGGYLMCANLLDGVRTAYSYGISGYDGWGCDVSRQFGVRVHQYDCFDLTQPACPGGDMVFHAECIAGETRTDVEGRSFDTLERQLARNGDSDRRVVVKMDVEGAEWDSLLQAPGHVLERIDQLAIELHGVDAAVGKYIAVVDRLKEFFHVAHLHFNNYSCADDLAPFPAYAYEVLFVSRRLGVLADVQGELRRPHPLDAPNNPGAPDCQYAGE